jgi:hypothetical protein
MRSRDMKVEKLSKTRHNRPESSRAELSCFRLIRRLIGAGSSVYRTPEHPIRTPFHSATSQSRNSVHLYYSRTPLDCQCVQRGSAGPAHRPPARPPTSVSYSQANQALLPVPHPWSRNSRGRTIPGPFHRRRGRACLIFRRGRGRLGRPKG